MCYSDVPKEPWAWRWEEAYITRVTGLTSVIMVDSAHPLHDSFEPLLSGRLLRQKKGLTNWFVSSCVPSATKLDITSEKHFSTVQNYNFTTLWFFQMLFWGGGCDHRVIGRAPVDTLLQKRSGCRTIAYHFNVIWWVYEIIKIWP